MYKGQDLLSISQEKLQEIRGKEIGLIVLNPFSQLNPTRKVGSQMIEALLPIHQQQNLPRSFTRMLAINQLQRLGIQNPNSCYEMYPQELSGGMCQRVVIGMFALLKPKILLSDEPTTALDPETIHLVLDELRNLQAAHIFVTHDQFVAQSFCDTIFDMQDVQLCS